MILAFPASFEGVRIRSPLERLVQGVHEVVICETHDDVIVLSIDNPPVNALGASVRQGLAAQLREAEANSAVTGIVIRGCGKFFSGGADISEFGRPPIDPPLPQVISAIENCTKPVVAAIGGTCLGGGLEVALACHFRIGVSAARLGLPEVKLGLLPGAGGTQRLPRLTGIAAALDMIVGGDPVPAQKALEVGLLDAIVEAEELEQAAIRMAREASGPRPTGARSVADDPGVFEAFAAANARRLKGLRAPGACVDAIRASALPLEQGLARERELFLELMQGTESKALRHIFFAERAAGKIEGLSADTVLRPIKRVGVIGAGTMGGGIAMNFLSAGIPVTILETAPDALERGITVIRRNYEATAAKGRMSPDQVEQAMALLAPTLDFEALADCDLVVEAVYENMEVKKDIFARLAGIAKPGAILASNTSYLDIDEIASVTGRAGDVFGLHFFSPANVMKLTEVIRGNDTAPDVLATGMDIARRIGKVPVVSGVCYGFIGNRMLSWRQRQAQALLLEGATPEQIDRVHLEFGMPMGPFQMADLAGVDIGWHRDPSRIETIRDALCAANRLGQKAKAGFYDYDDKRNRSPSAAVSAIIDEFRAKAGVKPRAVSDEEIVARTLYTMFNEGQRILEEGIAQRSSDIDVVWLYGYGWPRAKGGPMFWAETIGWAEIASELGRYRAALGSDFNLARRLESELQTA